MKYLITACLLALIGCSIHSNHESSKLGVDAHMHVHSQDIEDDMQFTGGRALFAADSIGLSHAIILSNSYSKNVTKDYSKKQNDYIYDEMAKNPKHLAAACAINPVKSWAINEIKRCHTKGFKVLKLHTMASGMDLKIPNDLKKLTDVLKVAEDLNFTVLIHGYFPEIRRGNESEILIRELEKFPKLKLIIAHLLGAEFRYLENFIHPNFWVEISATPIMLKNQKEKLKLVETMRKVGMKHFVFGSDWPVFHPAEILKALQNLPLKPNEIDSILFSNSESLRYLFDK